jgi:alanine racemase
VHREAQIDWLAAHKTQRPHHVFLKLNSGMNRLGFTPRRSARRGSGCRACAGRQHRADDPLRRCRQRARRGQPAGAFEAATHDLPGERSLANSAATLRFAADLPALRGDWIRPGIMVYGSSPDFPLHGIAHWELQPTMTLRAQIHCDAGARAAATSGYGSLFSADRAMRIGVVACGYADGYPRPGAHRHTGARRRRAHAPRGPGVDGHGDGRPHRRCRRPHRAAR